MKKFKTPKQLNSILKQITDQFHPQKVILFGSYAYGRPGAESDVDLLVVMNTPERPMRVAAKISASVDHPFSMDILVYTPEEMERRLKWGDGLLHDAVNKGVVLYEEPAH